MRSGTKDKDTSTVPNPLTTKKSRRWLILIALAILIIISSIVGVALYQNQVNTATGQANATATGQVQATNTAQLKGTATAQHNAYLSALAGDGTLAFSDPLAQESGSQWKPEIDETTCEFTGGAYHIKPQGKYFKECNAPGIYNNFAFEVQMTIIQGDCAGIVFRDNEKGKFYYFSIYSDGKYDIGRYADYGLFEHLLPYGRSATIRTGLGQQNKIAVRATGSTLTFYINEQQIQKLNDKGYTLGSVGLAAYPNIGNAADISFSNAQLWTL